LEVVPKEAQRQRRSKTSPTYQNASMPLCLNTRNTTTLPNLSCRGEGGIGYMKKLIDEKKNEFGVKCTISTRAIMRMTMNMDGANI
jgi:hypothetical protein